MQQLLIASILFVLSSAYVLFLNYLAISPIILQRTIVVPLIIVLVILFFASRFQWKKMLSSQTTWLLLFLCTVITQLIVISTGGMSSPFLIIIHLIMIGVSFAFSFSISLLFLIFSFAVLLIDWWFFQNQFVQTLENPTRLILQIASLFPIIPISYIISEHYHLKDRLFKKLHTQVITDEVILKSLNELIIITDTQLKILSVNDSVERALRLSRFELLDQPLFQILLLRDSKGALVDKKTFFPTNDTSQPKKIQEQFTFVRSPFIRRHVTVQVQPVRDVDNSVSQLTFIISFNTDPASTETHLKDILENAQTKYEALTESIKKKLESTDLKELQISMTLLEKMENDMYHAQTLETMTANAPTAIDVAQLCKQLTRLEQLLASTLGVDLKFELKNFGEKDIAPLTVKNFPVQPEQLTGPFFTISSHLMYLELAVRKLLDVALLLASKEKSARVLLTLERHENETLLLEAQASSSAFSEEDKNNIFVPYNEIIDKRSVYASSGLEGLLLKKAIEALNLSLAINHHPESSVTTISLVIPKSTNKPH